VAAQSCSGGRDGNGVFFEKTDVGNKDDEGLVFRPPFDGGYFSGGLPRCEWVTPDAIQGFRWVNENSPAGKGF